MANRFVSIAGDRAEALSREDYCAMRSIRLLTEKPQVLVVNLSQERKISASLLAIAPGARGMDANLDDLSKSFIRADVMPLNDLFRSMSVQGAKAKNLQRLEGIESVVKNGDLMVFRREMQDVIVRDLTQGVRRIDPSRRGTSARSRMSRFASQRFSAALELP